MANKKKKQRHLSLLTSLLWINLHFLHFIILIIIVKYVSIFIAVMDMVRLCFCGQKVPQNQPAYSNIIKTSKRKDYIGKHYEHI